MKNKLWLLPVLVVFFVFGCDGPVGPSGPGGPPGDPYPIVNIPPIVNAPGAVLPADPGAWTTAEKDAWVTQASRLIDAITSADFRGRMSGDIGYEMAAQWAAANFRNWGLQPLDGSYFQPFDLSYTMPIGPTVISILVNGQVWKSTANGDYIDDMFIKDFMAAHGSNTGTARGRVSFLGFGIDATEGNTYANNEFAHINSHTQYRGDFNEYVGLTWAAPFNPDEPAAPIKTNLNVQNRIVIFRNATPNGLSNVDYRALPENNSLDPEDYRFTIGNDWIRHDEHYIKIGVARHKGAIGLLYNQMVVNPNIRYQPPIGNRPFVIAHVGSIGRNTGNGNFAETTYSNGTGDSRLLNDLFALQLEIEEASGGTKRTLTDLIARAYTVQTSAGGGTGALLTLPMKNFGDGKGAVPDYVQLLYNSTQNLFRGPNSTASALNGPYDPDWDASIATNSFHFDNSIEIEISSVAQEGINVRSGNVVGVVRGDELPDEYVIYMGHYDHSGITWPWINHGAADNGAGSAALMIAGRYAAQMAAAGNPPKRSLVFILDGGEESGMYGAKAAAAYFESIGKEKVIAVFHTDATLPRGAGNVTVSTSGATPLNALLTGKLLSNSEGRYHPWGTSAANLAGIAGPTAILTMNNPSFNSAMGYVGRPRTDVAAWQDIGVPFINVSASSASNFTSLYHAPYNDRYYVGDHLSAILGIATAVNMYTVADQ